MQYPGYGRGWQEEKARGIVGRFHQVMREPATTKQWYAAIFIVTTGAALLSILAA